MSTPSSERVVPGSTNLPPAPWPATAVSTTVDTDAIAQRTIAAFNDALTKKDYDAVATLFFPDNDASGATAFWRDHLALSWELRTLKGREKIKEFLAASQAGVVKLEVDDSSAMRRPQVANFRPKGDVKGVQFFVRFESAVGVGRGLVRLVEVEGGEWKIWTLFTTLEELKGFEERKGARREVGVQHGGLIGRRNWAERRRDEGEFEGTEPQVLIIGRFSIDGVVTRECGDANCLQGLARRA
jgi:hypothetical protein